jgi:hypothetical protein
MMEFRVQPEREGKVRSILLVAVALLGLTGCVTKLVDQSCQDRGYGAGSALYQACYPSAGSAIARTYAGAVQTSLEWPFVALPP